MDKSKNSVVRSLLKRPLIALVLILAIGSQFGYLASAQHGPTTGHLIGSGEFGDIDLVSVERVTTTANMVADVTVNPAGTYAFLANWGEPDCAGPEVGGQTSPDAGAWVIDITNLSDPKTVGFIPSHQDTRPGEGMQVIRLTTKFFTGDVLVMNNEHCGKNGKGGVSLFDVTDPLKPYKLSEHFGDRNAADANDIHSAFAWDAGDKAYVVIVDNFEFPDVDIMDITNPKRPVIIAEYDLNTYDVDQPALGLTESFIHDMVVKEIAGRFIMLVSYWDGGFVKLDVTDPANAVFLGDTEYNNPDPELLESAGISLPPEGNGHEAEFTLDSKFFLGTDEDFAPYGAAFFSILPPSPFAGSYPSAPVPGAAPIAILADQLLNGPTVYGGYGCPGSAQIPLRSNIFPAGSLQPGEEAIVVLQRGPLNDPSAPEPACFPGEKAANAAAAGYDAVLFVQRHGGEEDPPFCGSGGFSGVMVGICTNHEAYHKLFNTPVSFGPYPDGPAIGTIGDKIEAGALFDGWGYVHLYGNTPGEDEFLELDTFAIAEAHDETYATGFGDLSVHEAATDPQDAAHAYLSYYAGGFRSIEIVCTDPSDSFTCELIETGGYLDPAGNNFWGVQPFIRDGVTYILGSDMDSGLWIFRRNAP
jgi:hypothetical protein